ncbi:MAG TPA: ABC transporter substrate-binding protein [Desulfatiglandales bacterium]|nr:ABC transporter substrate-binding protein [Desulfatiglandales bacterium]
MRKVFILALIVGFLSLGLGTSAWAKPIKAGAIINLTGPASSWGQFHAKGHKDYFRYVNEVKGGIGGNKIDLTVVDHAYKVADSVTYVKKFCTLEKMDIIATWDAGSGNMAKPIIQKYKTPTFNYSTDQAILNPPIDYMYLPFGSYIMDSYAILEYIRTIHPGREAPKVGLLTYNNAYGKTIHDPSKEYAAMHGLNIVAIEQFPTKTVDLTTELLRLKEAGAEYVFVQILPSHIILALKCADKISYDVPFFGTWTATDPDFFPRGTGLIRNRMHMQFTGSLPVDGMPGIKLLETLWDRYKTVDKFDCSYWEGVVVASLMVRAFQRAHERFGKVNNETINDALETFRDEDFGGLVPNTTYTKTDHGGSFTARIVKINEDQTYTPLTTFFVPGKEPVRLLKR